MRVRSSLLLASLLFASLVSGLAGCSGALVGPNGRLIRVVVEGDRILFDDPILFGNDSDEILHESDALLDQIALTFREHEEITGATIEGHSSLTGSASHNQDLSQRRATSVVNALRERGVQQPLTAVGVGQNRPLCTEETDECHTQNRRVEIHIVR